MPKSPQLKVSLNEAYRKRLELIQAQESKKTLGQTIRFLIDSYEKLDVMPINYTQLKKRVDGKLVNLEAGDLKEGKKYKFIVNKKTGEFEEIK